MSAVLYNENSQIVWSVLLRVFLPSPPDETLSCEDISRYLVNSLPTLIIHSSSGRHGSRENGMEMFRNTESALIYSDNLGTLRGVRPRDRPTGPR